MKIFPAIDIKDGKCVRLLKGDFQKSTEYNKTPLEQAKAFSKLGYRDLHIIDLDGALEGKPINGKLIEEICRIKKIKVQIGGGIRSVEYIKRLIDIGIDRVILGTIAVEDIKFFENVCGKFENKIAIALDVRNGFIALRGWKKQTEIKASEFVKKIENFGVSRIIYTDINRDGTLTKPNLEETFKLSKLTKIPVLVSGGVSSINDIENIANQNKSDPRIEGVIIGKAIYDGKIDHDQLIKMSFFN
tara:strand:- start:1067 stop:1801 length:735 start_codon:yes stop_codon:yes gene_type:complete